MILEQRTLEIFGYSASELKNGSNKLICVSCDYCNAEINVSKKIMNKSREFVQKDACKACRYKKLKDVNMARYGVENVFQLESVQDKSKETSIEKYGVEKYSKTQEHKNKLAKNNRENKELYKIKIIEKYGVDNVSKLESVKEKRKRTNLDKYGSEQFLASEYAREKITDTVNKKYGVDNVFSSQEVQEKIRQSNRENLGVDYPMQSDNTVQKSKKTNLDKYGVENPLLSPEIRDKIKQTNLDRYGVENPTTLNSIKEKIKATSIKNGHIKIYKGKTMAQLSSELGKAYSTFVVHVRNHGFDFAINIKRKENGLEAIVRQLLERNNIEFKRHARINGRYTDFLIESHKLIIESDGLYWHCDEVLHDNKYHAKKQADYKSAGYKSLFFRENELKQKLPIVESIILNALNKSTKVYARECKFIKLDKKSAKEFFAANHLMGKGAGDTFALIKDGKIFSAMQLKYRGNERYEISRFCNALNFSVIGGFSKILKNIERNIKMKELITYIDLRYGSGDYLKDFGFQELKTFLSFKWVGENSVFNRMKYPNNTGYKFGLAKLWDCGQRKLIKKY